MVDKDYIDISTITPIKVFSAKLAEVTLKYTMEHKPYDEPCARLDFRDKLETAERESERVYGFINPEKVNVNIDDFDFEKYGEKDRFVLIEDQVDQEDTLVNNMKVKIITGHTLSYRCKNRGHGISVFIPIDKYNEMQEDKEKKKELIPNGKIIRK